MIRVVKVSLLRDVPFAEWVHRMGHVSRHVYNRTVSEYLYDDEYTGRVVVDILQPFKLPDTRDDFTSGTLEDDYQVYDFGPPKKACRV